MSKLICYGITHNALKVIQSTTSSLDVPDGWFDWMFPNKNSRSGQAVCRIQILDVQCSDSSLAQWNAVAREAGFNCVLVFSTEDNPAFAHHSSHLDGDVELIPVGVVPNEAKSLGRAALLKRLREPESFFQILWNSTREGGLLCIEDLGMSEVPIAHWWAYGNGLRKWIASAKPKGAQEELWQRSRDYSKWNAWKAVGVADVKLDLDLCWNAKTEIGWHWNTSTPCTMTDILSLRNDGFSAYYPMRQIPCCGIARRIDGSLETIGALPDEKDANGNWVWDDGSIRRALAQQSFRNPIEALILAGLATIVALAPIRAGNEGLSSGMANLRQFLLNDGHKTFWFDQNLQPTTYKNAPIGLSLTQKVDRNTIPHEEFFELITSVWIKSNSKFAFSIGVMINGAEPNRWTTAPSNKKFELCEKVRSSDEIQYVLRREI